MENILLMIQRMIFQTFSQGLSESEVELFFCDLCNFNTEHKKGLTIHISKVHKNKCDCGMKFENKDTLERHEKAKQLYSNVDP